MNKFLNSAAAALVVSALLSCKFACGDSFGTGDYAFELEFVPIGNPGNEPDMYGFGAVNYDYRIGKYEVHQAAMFNANKLGNLRLDFGKSESDWQELEEEPNKPVSNASWEDALRFVNWLNTASGSVPAYKFNDFDEFQLWQPEDSGYDPNNQFRNRLAKYFLPSTDEWQKAAHYDPAKPGGAGYYLYPTGSDTPPDGIDFRDDSEFEAVFIEKDYVQQNDFDHYLRVEYRQVTDVGVLSPYGTAGQGGSAWELLETEWDLVNDNPYTAGVEYVPPDSERLTLRTKGGGLWDRGVSSLSLGWWADTGTLASFWGFRVASRIPEPSTLILTLIVMAMPFNRRQS